MFGECYTIRQGRCLEASVAPPMNSDLKIDISLTRHDWRVLLRAAERECYYLARRSKRSTSKPEGVDARALEQLRRLLPVLARVADDEPRFV
jgi:hypothetical protein